MSALYQDAPECQEIFWRGKRVVFGCPDRSRPRGFRHLPSVGPEHRREIARRRLPGCGDPFLRRPPSRQLPFLFRLQNVWFFRHTGKDQSRPILPHLLQPGAGPAGRRNRGFRRESARVTMYVSVYTANSNIAPRISPGSRPKNHRPFSYWCAYCSRICISGARHSKSQP